MLIWGTTCHRKYLLTLRVFCWSLYGVIHRESYGLHIRIFCLLPFLLFSFSLLIFLAGTSDVILNKSKNKNCKEWACVLFQTLILMISVVVYSSIMLKYTPFIPSLFLAFIIKKWWIFVKILFGPIMMTMWFCPSSI